ncbi:hypothetical protein [Faecalispora anaeroviscerum]|uniref:hypothetical protein n=1 Tax=Faecalispora anaeroviscerum TaxID=2991836 RepID=UPI0024BB764F|nr:hypothetical protein [Faecalispora anaeroviscerum]
MSQHAKAALQSKLMVYSVCYQEAKKTKDLKRMVLLGTIISDLKNEISILVD